MRHRVAVLAAVLGITLFGLTVYPGRTFLQSDTQIYIPVLQWLEDRSLYPEDLIPTGAHVSLTFYDEAARGGKAITGSYQASLELQQALFRACGIFGVFLIATSAGLAAPAAMGVAFLMSLGATIIGPAVLTVEYEPVPRGFAVGLILLSAGLFAHGRFALGAIAAGLALLYHAPAVWPLWLMVPFLPRRKELLIALGASIAILIPLSIPQASLGETQRFFAILSPEHAELQRLRASYNWISLWFARYAWFYFSAWAVSLAAFWRIGRQLPATVQVLFLGMPAIGIFTMPVSYVLLEKVGWALLPQLQPMRALLFTVLFAVILASIAAFTARAWWERLAWLAVVLTVPFLHGGQNPKRIETSQLAELSEWAASATPATAVFLFPEEGRALPPGIFRARSRRTVWVDWKAGGQVNYFPQYAQAWWKRWNEALAPPFTPDRVPALANLGIDYLVLTKTGLPGVEPAWSNSAYRVYRIR